MRHTRHCESNYDFQARCSCGADVTTLSVDQLRAEVVRLRRVVSRISDVLHGMDKERK